MKVLFDFLSKPYLLSTGTEFYAMKGGLAIQKSHEKGFTDLENLLREHGKL